MAQTIREFANSRIAIRQWDHSEAERVRTEYNEAGYYSVKAGLLGVRDEWQEMHRWCRDCVGEDHYSWTGSTFWFENQRDAIMFALRWA